MALENMGLGDFRYVDYSWVSPWSQHSTFGIRLYAEGIDPAAVCHQHSYEFCGWRRKRNIEIIRRPPKM